MGRGTSRGFPGGARPTSQVQALRPFRGAGTRRSWPLSRRPSTPAARRRDGPPEVPARGRREAAWRDRPENRRTPGTQRVVGPPYGPPYPNRALTDSYPARERVLTVRPSTP